MFLKIENPGVAPVESFTVLGLSTARGDAAKIGQFGSGAKHGILTCLRNNIVPKIYLGYEPLEFATEQSEMAGKKYSRVLYSFRGNVERTSMALEFGGMDWDSIAMGLREFVSNAIDSVDDCRKIAVELVTTVEPCENTTRVYLPLTPEVNRFYSELSNRFLHFAAGVDISSPILVKGERTKAKIYRKGVFVREHTKPSIFDYNFGDGVKIDESRNMDNYSIVSYAADAIKKADVDTLKKVFANLGNMKGTFEGEFSEYHFSWLTQTQKDNWVEAFRAIHGDSAVIAETVQGPIIEMAIRKGAKVIVIDSLAFYKGLESAGIPTVISKVDNVDSKGRQTKPATSKLVARVMKIWSKLESRNLTNGKQLPAIKMFTNIMNGGCVIGGYYKDGTIFINDEFDTDDKCILEELAHHITGACDETRDFQDYAFKVAAIFMSRAKVQ